MKDMPADPLLPMWDPISGWSDAYKPARERIKELSRVRVGPRPADEPVTKSETALDRLEEKTQRDYGSNSMDASSGSTTSSFSRGLDNNFGFIDAPGIIGLASGLPGPAGLVGMGINGAINANNVSSVNSAREALGLESLGIGQTIGGILGFNSYDDGFVGQVSINGQPQAVSLNGGVFNGNPTISVTEAMGMLGLSSESTSGVDGRGDPPSEADYGFDPNDDGPFGGGGLW